jgi:signal transduction histidine kinase
VGRDVAFVRDVLPTLLVLLGLCVSVPLTATLATGSGPGVIFTAVWMVALTLPLVWRRRWPSTVTAVVAVVFITGQVAEVPEDLIGQLALMIVLYTVGAVDTDRRRAWLVRGGVVVLIAVWIVIALISSSSGEAGVNRAGSTEIEFDQVALIILSVLGNIVVLSVAIALGETAWVASKREADLQARTVQLQTRTVQLQKERGRVAQQAVALDRMSIARDLHDVVAHHVSLMGIQASLARRLLEVAPDQAGAALDEVEAGARRAVHDLGALLTTLREDSAATPGTGDDRGESNEADVSQVERSTPASTLGLHRLSELVEQARRSGLRVQLQAPTPGDLALVPSVAGHIVYRLIQEALTNTRKHAGAGAHVEVLVEVRRDNEQGDGNDRSQGDVVLVQVNDDGNRDGPVVGDEGGDRARVPMTPVPGTGLGLAGMRERVQATGGRLRIGYTSEGFSVSAVLPLEPTLR